MNVAESIKREVMDKTTPVDVTPKPAEVLLDRKSLELMRKGKAKPERNRNGMEFLIAYIQQMYLKLEAMEKELLKLKEYHVGFEEDGKKK